MEQITGREIHYAHPERTTSN